MQDLSDEDLVTKFRAAAGSPGANIWINELFQRFHTRVATWCFRFTGDRESAADLAQDIFLKAYRNLDSFRGDAKFSTWLYSISRNHCVNEMRSRSARPEEVSNTLDLECGKEESVLRALEKQEALRTMQELIGEALDDTETKVMTLHYGEDITLDAITRLLGLTNASGAKAYVVSAKRKLSATVERWKARERRGLK